MKDQLDSRPDQLGRYPAKAKLYEAGTHCNLDEPMQDKSWIRILLISIIVAGIALMIAGPIMRVSNEGFGDIPGPISVSNHWQRLSYILVPIGAGVSIVASRYIVRH